MPHFLQYGIIYYGILCNLWHILDNRMKYRPEIFSSKYTEKTFAFIIVIAFLLNFPFNITTTFNLQISVAVSKTKLMSFFLLLKKEKNLKLRSQKYVCQLI